MLGKRAYTHCNFLIYFYLCKSTRNGLFLELPFCTSQIRTAASSDRREKTVTVGVGICHIARTAFPLVSLHAVAAEMASARHGRSTRANRCLPCRCRRTRDTSTHLKSPRAARQLGGRACIRPELCPAHSRLEPGDRRQPPERRPGGTCLPGC